MAEVMELEKEQPLKWPEAFMQFCVGDARPGRKKQSAKECDWQLVLVQTRPGQGERSGMIYVLQTCP